MRKLGLAGLLGLGALALVACEEVQQRATSEDVKVIPEPANVRVLGGWLNMSAGAAILNMSGDPEVENVATRLRDMVQKLYGVELAAAGPKAHISFSKDARLPDEGYRLDIRPDRVIVEASSTAGHFYGAMTLAQMMDSGEKGRLANLPVGTIEDAPRLKWRGTMLDVSRHFRTTEFIKKFLDVMALHKLNVFHWHLTDDQAWRLEIRKYPKLTEVGGCRVPAGNGPRSDVDPATSEPRQYCGYYTQEEVREIVAYAAERHITVMPEIDLPGHATAAVAAYPQFGTVTPFEGDMADWGIFQNTFNLEDETLSFLEDVMVEVLDLFPSDFIHIGGDEVATKQWEESARITERMAELGIEDAHQIQAYFTRHFAEFLDARGRRLIGWDEILEGGSIGNSAIMSWRGTKGGVEAAKAGRQVVMAPSSIYYTDYRQSASRHEPPGREHIQTLEDVYGFEPVSDELTADEKMAVLGAQMTIFSEHMRTEARVEHMAFPRVVALSESVWSKPEQKDFADFIGRLMPHMARLNALGIRAADSAFAPFIDVSNGDDGARTVVLRNQAGQGDIRYTLDGSVPTAASRKYGAPFEANADQTVKAATFLKGKALSRVRWQALDAVSLSERTGDELTLCSKALAIKLDDDFPIAGDRAALMVDIIKPCWIYEAPNMTGVTGLEVVVGNLPYNFQIGDLINQVDLLAPQTEAGELVVFKDSCETGEELTRLPLAPAKGSFGVTTLKAKLSGAEDAQALCFHVAASHYEPMWAIDRVRLTAE